jgi:hypothetical protein
LRVAGELGVWLTNRKLSWSGATDGTDGPLRSYDANAIFVPSFRLELYPGAWGGARSLLAGIGGFVEYGQSVGLKVKPPSGSPEGNHAGRLTSLDLGALWRLHLISGSRFALAPALAYRSLQVTTSSKDGRTIPGVPDTRPSGFQLRLDAELPVTPSVLLLGGGGYTLWTSKKDVVGTFFGKGSARGYSLDAGASWRFMGPLSVKALVAYESVSYTGLGDPKPTYGTASGARDAYLGGRFMVRAEY